MIKEKNSVSSECKADNLGGPGKRQYVKPEVQIFRLDKLVQGGSAGTFDQGDLRTKGDPQ